MTTSNNEKVEKFLKEITLVNKDYSQILEELRKIVFKVFPETKERMMYGGIMFSLEHDFGGIFVSKNHVSCPVPHIINT